MTAMNASDSVPIETHHEDMIHDAQLDYYGKRLATCSSDRTVRVFDSLDAAHSQQGGHILKGHTGPVWQVAWTHPCYGAILASCSYDGKVLIWKEHVLPGSGAGAAGAGGGAATHGTWSKIKEHNLHSASVNSISWAPHELGAILACASSDGKLSVLTFKNDGSWDADIFNGHAIGCNAVSWAPAILPSSLIVPSTAATASTIASGPTPALPNNSAAQSSTTSAPSASGLNTTGMGTGPGSHLATTKRFASAGCDNLVRIWAYNDAAQHWVQEDELAGHTDWVRDVAWAPNVGLPRSYIATAGQDRVVFIWSKDVVEGGFGSVSATLGGSGNGTRTATGWVKTQLDPSTVPSAAMVSPAQVPPALASGATSGSSAAAGAVTAGVTTTGTAGTGTSPSQPGKFPDVVWRVSWSLAGNVLAVSCGDGKVTLWKESLKGVWECVNELAS